MNLSSIFKCYFSFCSFLYKLFYLLLIPVAAIILIPVLQNIFNVPVFFIILPCIICLDILSDLWFLSGVCEKNSHSLEITKLSSKGRTFLFTIVLLDIIRRILFIAGISIFSYYYSLNHFAESVRYFRDISTLLILCFGSIAITQFLVLIGRFLANMLLPYILAYLGAQLEFIVFFLIKSPSIFKTCICVVLFLLSTILLVYTILKKREESYYDK